jgi:hypothetical protein
MPLTAEIRLRVRKRAAFHPDNLIYCCFRCNQYKGDYWPQHPGDAPLWNPRHESGQAHFALLADGRLAALTPTGEATLRRLQLNRLQLVAHRLRARNADAQSQLLARHRQLTQALLRLLLRQSAIIREQNALLGRGQEHPDRSSLPFGEAIEKNLDE